MLRQRCEQVSRSSETSDQALDFGANSDTSLLSQSSRHGGQSPQMYMSSGCCCNRLTHFLIVLYQKGSYTG